MRSRFPGLSLGLLAALLLAAQADDSDNAQKAPEHKIAQSKSYLPLDPIVDDDRAQGMLMVGVGLDVPDPILRQLVTRSMPMLRDAFAQNLMAYTANSVHTQPDVGEITERLQDVTDHALGRKGAKLLLAQVALRVVH